MGEAARQNLGNRGSRCRLRQPVTGLQSPATQTSAPAPGQSFFAYESGASVARLVQAQAYPGELPADEHPDESLPSGEIPVGTGSAAVVRIPIPGTSGLAVEFKARGWTPKGGSTSSIFFQDLTGKRHLRLDFGPNKLTGRIDYHWNQKGTAEIFGVTGHSSAGRGGSALYQGAKYFRYAGRRFVLVGAGLDAYSIVVAKKRWRQVAKVVTGWAGAWAGCKLLGAGGAIVGTAVSPVGTAVGGVGGCIVGGIGGYSAASWAAGEAYDMVEETFFEEVPEIEPPSNPGGR